MTAENRPLIEFSKRGRETHQNLAKLPEKPRQLRLAEDLFRINKGKMKKPSRG